MRRRRRPLGRQDLDCADGPVSSHEKRADMLIAVAPYDEKIAAIARDGWIRARGCDLGSAGIEKCSIC